MATACGVTRQTIANWAKVHPEFSEAHELADTFAQAHWECRLDEIAMTGKGNAMAVIFVLKNRFRHDWR